jgi:hypothetical protein
MDAGWACGRCCNAPAPFRTRPASTGCTTSRSARASNPKTGLPCPPGPFCGYSGGIGPATVVEILGRIAAPDGALYWIDMESGVRTDGAFDLAKCEAVCRAVYG